MDDIISVPEVQRSEHNVHDFPHSRPNHNVAPVQPEELRELKLTDEEQVARILQQYNELDVPRENIVEFTAMLLHSRNAWFVEVGQVGLVYFTHIIPRVDAQFRMLFWDKRLTGDRRECAKLCISAAFALFSLRRVSCAVVESNIPLRKTLEKIGFVPEGTIRQVMPIGENFHNLCNYGLLKEEITWPALKTSLV